MKEVKKDNGYAMVSYFYNFYLFVVCWLFEGVGV